MSLKIGEKLNTQLTEIFARSKDSKLYNAFVGKLGISTSYNSVRNFANGTASVFSEVALNKILDKFGYETRVYIVKTSDKDKDKIQYETSKEFIEILDNILITLEEEDAKKKFEKAKKELEKERIKKSKQPTSMMDSLTKDFGIDDEVLNKHLLNTINLSE